MHARLVSVFGLSATATEQEIVTAARACEQERQRIEQANAEAKRARKQSLKGANMPPLRRELERLFG